MEKTCAILCVYFKVFPLLTRLLTVKYKRMSCFISVLYLMAIAKLKLNRIEIKSIEFKHFKNLIAQNKYKLNFNGDIYSCALVSINTLIALSMKSASYMKITKVHSQNKQVQNNQEIIANGLLKIIMPTIPIDKHEIILDNENKQDNTNTKGKTCWLQCVCLSSVQEDFVLYVTNSKLFNISMVGNKEDEYNEPINEVLVTDFNTDINPPIAKYAAVSNITSSGSLSTEDYEYILCQYFRKPRLLSVGDVFSVNVDNYIKKLESFHFNVQNPYFKVNKLSGEHKSDIYFVLKDFTSLYLDPPVHGYIPSKLGFYRNLKQSTSSDTISLCPDGLLKQYDLLRKMFSPFLTSKRTEIKPIFLLTGAKGAGKKTTLEAVVASFGLQIIHANCFDFYGLSPSLFNGKLNQLYAKVRRTVPCVVSLDNIELLGRKQNHHENSRIVDIFINQTDELWTRRSIAYPVIVVGVTTVTTAELVPSVARLFVGTVNFEVLKFDETYNTVKWVVKKLKMVCSDCDLIKVAEKVKGYVFADVILLVEHAVRMTIQNGRNTYCDNIKLSLSDFSKALGIMDAAYSDSIRAARVPSVHWDDIGGLGDLKKELILTLNLPLKHPELFNGGLKRSGIMFYGPPGTGKTLMAKAIATECNYNFLSVKGPELMNMYVGESEKNVREVFERARDAAPCIIFFDELDSLAPCRGKSGDSGGVTDRVVSQLLAEMDGLDKNKNVFVLAATNRPDLVDPALLRPGRFDKMFYVGICNDISSKLSVLRALTRRFSLGVDVNLDELSEILPKQVSGADLYSVSSNAWFSAARKAVKAIEKGEDIKLPLVVDSNDFKSAIDHFVPSLTVEDIEYYNKLKMTEIR